jgi:hypothetical protein
VDAGEELPALRRLLLAERLPEPGPHVDEETRVVLAPLPHEVDDPVGQRSPEEDVRLEVGDPLLDGVAEVAEGRLRIGAGPDEDLPEHESGRRRSGGQGLPRDPERSVVVLLLEPDDRERKERRRVVGKQLEAPLEPGRRPFRVPETAQRDPQEPESPRIVAVLQQVGLEEDLRPREVAATVGGPGARERGLRIVVPLGELRSEEERAAARDEEEDRQEKDLPTLPRPRPGHDPDA